MHRHPACACVTASPGRQHRADSGHQANRYVDENIGALDVAFTVGELAVLDQAFAPSAVAGTRYPESGMRVLNG
jgi:hypothetical protein